VFSQKVHNTVCVNLFLLFPQKVIAFTVTFHISRTNVIFKFINISKLLSPLRLASFGRKCKLVMIDLAENCLKRFVLRFLG